MSKDFTASQQASLVTPQTGVTPVFKKQVFPITAIERVDFALNYPPRAGSDVMVFRIIAATGLRRYLVEGIDFTMTSGGGTIHTEEVYPEDDILEAWYTY